MLWPAAATAADGFAWIPSGFDSHKDPSASPLQFTQNMASTFTCKHQAMFWQ
jgi:hypothetical protein